MTTKCLTILAVAPILGLVLITSQATAASAAAPQHPVNQEDLAKALLSSNAAERQRALGEVMAIEPAQRGAALRTALITLLERENKLVEQALVRGVTVDQVESPEFISAVARAVAELKDPATIPVLAGALGDFNLIQALADFGEQAVSAVVAVVKSPKSHYSSVDDGLRVLRFVVEQQQSRPLSPTTFTLIRQAAENRLSGPQNFTTLWYAIDLAAVLGDNDLKRTIEDIANYPSEVTARGVINPRLIAQTQKRAADRLAGVPALPRPK